MAHSAHLRLFNAEWYLAQNPDVAAAVDAGLLTAEEHFRLFGNAEGRSPGPLFDTQYYLTANPDVAAAVAQGLMSAYEHFVQFGASENRPPLSLFDTQVYLTHSPDVAQAIAAGAFSAIEHFLLFGHAEGRIISPFIDLGAYTRANLDIAAAVTAGGGQFDVMSHLLKYGVGEGRDLGNGVNLGIFADDPAFQAALGNGSPQTALERVGEVAPFLPSFVSPPGWTPPPDTPIPLDFIPPEGTRLVVPPGVIVPPGTVLPDTFQPITPPAPPRPQPDGDDGWSPPTFNVEIIGKAGWLQDEDGPFSEGDTFILVFDVAVELGDAPFSVVNGASLGTGYTVTALPDGPLAQHYALQLGEGAALSQDDILTLRADHLRNASGVTAAQGLSITLDNFNSGFSLSKGVGFPKAFMLLPDFDYMLADESNFVIVSPAEDVHPEVVGGNESDIFVAYSNALQDDSDEETFAVSLNGGGGKDTLFAVLTEDTTPLSVADVERIITAHDEEAPDDTTLDFTNIAGAQEVWVFGPQGTVTLNHVPGPLEIGILPPAFGAWGPSVVDVRYAADAGPGPAQHIDLALAELDLLSISQHNGGGAPTTAGFTSLAIQLFGDNRISALTPYDPDDRASSVASTVKTIQLSPMAQVFAFVLGDATPEGFLEEVDPSLMQLIPGLSLGELWDELTIVIGALQGWSANFEPEEIFDLFSNANLNLSDACLDKNHEIAIRMADLDPASGEKMRLDSGADRGLPTAADGRQSDLVIVLPAQVEGGATITIENATLASTSGYTSQPLWNDVIDISGWMGCGCGAELVDHVVSFTIDKGADLGDDWYVDFSMEIDWDGDLDDDSDIFTFTLTNIATREHYNEMLKAVDTVAFLKTAGQAWAGEDEKNYTTAELVYAVGPGRAIAELKQDGTLYTAFKLDDAPATPLDLTRDDGDPAEAALRGLVGILVNEGTLWQESIFSF